MLRWFGSTKDARSDPLLETSERDDPFLGSAANNLEVPKMAVYMIFLISFLNTLAGSISNPMMAYYAHEFGATTEMIGNLFAVRSFTSTIGVPVINGLSDKIGRRPVLLLSLLGTGIFSIAQGCAYDYWALFWARALSGIWSAADSGCFVYITDITPEADRPALLAKLALLPGVALISGPAIGGSLAIFGLNFPILLDGVISIASAVLVAFYLPETPAFLAAQRARAEQEQQRTAINSASGNQNQAAAALPRTVYVLGFGMILSGITFSTNMSMLPVKLHEQYDFNTLQVGFTFVGSAIVMIVVNAFVTNRIQKALGLQCCAALASCINGIGLLLIGSTNGFGLNIASFYISTLGETIVIATRNAVFGLCTNASNRGRFFGITQMCLNGGRMLGPFAMGHLATLFHSIDLPFQVASLVALVNAFLYLLAKRMMAKIAVNDTSVSSLPTCSEVSQEKTESSTPETQVPEDSDLESLPEVPAFPGMDNPRTLNH
eukprot:gnl/MRDRNA2_/MRDRNA2_73010_c0_seq1.p1 gnl/MRDRNA2_/MRDRNA2_73010_c0~~gnl/MRDRNA2_/MRDRNA2_73010_c0_seq1.p1  ORF type:complete len:492 (+),score=70.25 gnl/MRDRNA2_/MRDRNA2_73010_c0_seq1:77-1552(+)